jgi:MbtH protein
MFEQNEEIIYKSVVNHEEQYSIWPANRDNPSGWRDAGKTGTKEEVLDYIQNIWVDMRPLSLRRALESSAESSMTRQPSETPLLTI